MALPPPPPKPPARSRVVQFAHGADELNYIVIDRITSLRIIAPQRPPDPNDWNAYGAAIWRVQITMGADVVIRRFHARWYMDDGSAFDPFQAFNMAREDAIVFARELIQQINELRR